MYDTSIGEDRRAVMLAYKQCFGTDSGQKVLKDLENYCGVGKPSFIKRESFNNKGTFEKADPLEMAFMEGRKDIYYLIQRITGQDLPE